MQTTRTTTKASASQSPQATQTRRQAARASRMPAPKASGTDPRVPAPTVDPGTGPAIDRPAQSLHAVDPTVVPFLSAASLGTPAPGAAFVRASTIAADASLLSLRSFVILTIAFVMALTVGAGTMLTAVYVASETPIYVSVLTGFAAFSATFLTAAAGLNGLISR